MKKIISIVMIVSLLALCITACDSNSTVENTKIEIKITEDQVNNAFADSDYIFTTEGTLDDISLITVVVNDVNVSKLTGKSYVRDVVNTMMKSPSSITLGDLGICKVFIATMQVCGLFEDPSKFNENEFMEVILSIICDNQSKVYENWTISASINIANDSITVTAKSN